MIHERHGDQYRIGFDSMAEILEIESHEKNIHHWQVPELKDPKYRGERGFGTGWYGVGTVGDVHDAVANGWADGIRRAEELPPLELPKLKMVRRRRRRGAVGDSIDMQRVYRGDLDTAWERMERAEVDGALPVTIMVPIGGNAGMDADKMFWRGAAAVAAIDALQVSGRPVKVVAYFQNSRTFQSSKAPIGVEVKIPVKEFTEPLDTDRLFVAVALAGMFRVYGFKAIYSCPYVTRGSLGCTENRYLPDWMVDGAALEVPADIDSLEAAKRWLAGLPELLDGPVAA